MSENLAQRQAESQRDLLTELWERVDAVNAGGAYESQHEDPRDELDELPLEVVWEKGTPFSVLLGFGGPNVWIECDSRDVTPDYVLHVAWGGDRAELRGESVTRTGEYFRELVEETDQ